VKTFNNDWNKLGLYFIPSEGHYVSYFLKRSWGNYLFFPHPEIDLMFPFILASGGVYKVFDSTLPYPYTNKRLFDLFGAPTIGTGLDHHVDFLVENHPHDYFDVDLTITEHEFALKIGRENFRFIDGPLLTERPGNNLSRLKK
jgi:hypothetical protein